MVKEQLFIEGTEVALIDTLGSAFTYSIADIAQPDKRKADFSKTVLLPLSKEARKVFNHIFEINVDSTFNPNLKADAIYLVDSQTIFDGIIQVKKIITNENDKLTLEVNFTGKLKNIILEFGDKELDDSGMLWGDMDHVYNSANQQASWTPTLGTDYVYPMIYHGRHTNLQDFDVEDFFPSVFAKEYVDRMFADANFEYDSNFFDSTYFKSLIIPFNGAGELGFSDATITARQFEADTPLYDSNGTTTFVAPKTNMSGAGELIRFSNEVTDPNAQHDPATGIWTVGETGTYDISPLLDLTATFTPTGASNACYANCMVAGLIIIVKNSTIIHSSPFKITRDELVDITGETTTGTAYPDSDYIRDPGLVTLNYSGTPHARVAGPWNAYNATNLIGRNFDPPKNFATHAIDVPLQAGDTIKVYAKFQNIRISDFDGDGIAWVGNEGYFIDSVDTSWTTGFDGTIDLILGSGSFLKNKVKNPQISNGNNLVMADAIPKNIKQKDLFMAFVKMFNLYIEPDSDNPRKLKIEPRKDFYTSVVNDWSEKLDVSQDLEFHPMGALDAKTYLYTYKADKDYYNDKYTKAWDAVYGERDYEIVNDFLKNEKKLEVLFSPTPVVANSTIDYYIPHIISVDNQGQAKPVESNIRLLYWGGLIATSTPWNHTDGGVDDFQTSYPYAGHFDNPVTPTLDLNFGLVRELYYDDTYQTISWTDTNVFNTYHKDFIDEITDPNSKIVKGWFNLTPTDIHKLSFRELYWFDNAYHRLNKIENYTPTDVKLTWCEFLKLEKVTAFTGSSGNITGGKGEPAGSEIIPVKSGSLMENGNSYDSVKHNVQGEDNIIARSAENVNIQGDNNTVGEKSYNINLTNSNGNTVAGGLSNVTLINTNDISVQESDVVFINGISIGGDVVQQKALNFSTDVSVTTYEVDTSGGNKVAKILTADIFEGKIYIFKKTASANILTLSTDPGYTIEGETTIDIKKLNTSISVQYDGEQNFIII